MLNINKLLNIEYPILQGGMANIASGTFAAHVSNSGALGTIGSGGMEPKILEKEIYQCKSLTDKPFAVNLMMLNPYIDEMVDLIVKYQVPVVTAGAGNPYEYVEKFKENNIKLLPLIGAPSLGIRMERMRATALIAEGMEAGGHIGEMTTMTLLPQTVKEVNIPVIAAGGISGGKQMLAVEILGARGVQMGTAFLFTEECPIHENYKKAILKATASKVTVIGALNGMPIRVLKNSMTRKYKELEAQGAGVMELEKFTLGALGRAVRKGDVKEGSVMCGSAVGDIKEILPVKELLERVMREYEEAKKCLLK